MKRFADREAYELSVRLLSEKFPDVDIYQYQAQTLKELASLRAQVEKYKGALEMMAHSPFSSTDNNPFSVLAREALGHP